MFQACEFSLFFDRFNLNTALANVGKNVAWLSASATRAGIHQSLALHGNLADVTGKGRQASNLVNTYAPSQPPPTRSTAAGSQTMAAATLGTALGLTLAPLVSMDSGGTMLFPMFACLSMVHLTCVHRSLSSVALCSISGLRFRIACRPVLSQLRLHLRESMDNTKLFQSPIEVLTPSQVAAFEPVFPVSVSPFYSLPEQTVLITTGTAIDKLPCFAAYWHKRNAQLKHVVIVDRIKQGEGAACVHVLYTDDADGHAVLQGYLHAALVAELLMNGTDQPNLGQRSIADDVATVLVRM
jgi:hypothetical protein